VAVAAVAAVWEVGIRMLCDFNIRRALLNHVELSDFVLNEKNMRI
jgi:hypothetical protein